MDVFGDHLGYARVKTIWISKDINEEARPNGLFFKIANLLNNAVQLFLKTNSNQTVKLFGQIR